MNINSNEPIFGDKYGDGDKMIHNDYKKIRDSCICIVLFVIAFLIIIMISSAFIYFNKLVV